MQNPHKKIKRTMPIGVQQTLVTHNKPSFFQMMFWGAACSDTRVKRVCFRWKSEKLEEKDQHNEELARINEHWGRLWDAALERAKTPGTEEYIYMEDLDRRIAEGSTKWKLQRQTHQEFSLSGTCAGDRCGAATVSAKCRPGRRRDRATVRNECAQCSEAI